MTLRRTRLLMLLLVLAILWAFHSSPQAIAQGNTNPETSKDSTVLTFSPPEVPIELSDKEPLPNGVASEVNWGGGGLGGGVNRAAILADPGLYWLALPGSLTSPFVASGSVLRVNQDFRFDPTITSPIISGRFRVCGYTSPAKPQANIIYPSGKTEALKGGAVQAVPPSYTDVGNCWQVDIPWALGAERGVYTLKLDSSDGSLTHQWGVDYPRCGEILDVTLPVKADPRQTSRLLMGFTPGETLVINIYQSNGIENDLVSTYFSFIAQRKVTLDNEGAALLHFKLSRSSRLQLWLLNYFYFGANGTYYEYDPLDWYTGDNGPSMSDGTGLDERKPPCTPDPYRDTAIPLPVYEQPAAGAAKVADVQPRTPADILEEKVTTLNGRVVVWYHVLMPDQTTGWTSTTGQLVTEVPIIAFSAFARVMPNKRFVRRTFNQNEPLTFGNVDFNLYKSRDPKSEKLSVLVPGTIVQLIQSQEYNSDAGTWGEISSGPGDVAVTSVEDVWWQIKTLDGRTGWTKVGLASMGWGGRSQDANSAAATAPATTETPQFVCASPSTRLSVGGQGRIMPGQSNRIRKVPGGEVIGKAAPGTVFKVLEGPACTADGTVWWKIDANGMTGWTAEGKGTDYWVEPTK